MMHLRASTSWSEAFPQSRRLPLNICGEDEPRSEGVEYIDDSTLAEETERIVDDVRYAHLAHRPFSFWGDLDLYIEMASKKNDSWKLFGSACEQFHIPITNFKGWLDNQLSRCHDAAVRERGGQGQAERLTPILTAFVYLALDDTSRSPLVIRPRVSRMYAQPRLLGERSSVERVLRINSQTCVIAC